MPNSRKPAYVQRIEEALKLISTRAKRNAGYFTFERNEWHTRYCLIDPMLETLGWDLSDPEQVRVEHNIGKGRADYAFFHSGAEKPLMILEAKAFPWWRIPSLFEDFEEECEEECEEDEWECDDIPDETPEAFSDRQIAQLSSYVRSLRAGYGVLTDGDSWDVYDLNKRGNFKKKRIAHISVVDTPDDEIVAALRLLHRRKVLELR